MAATAYASLVSLLNTMHHIDIHPLLSTCFNSYPNKSLGQKVDFFLDFVENHPDPDNEEADDLFSQIADAVRKVEDRIEIEAADRVRDGAEQSPSFLADLHKRIEEMDAIKEKVICNDLARMCLHDTVKVKEETGGFRSSMPPPSPSDPPATYKTTTMVGFDGYLLQLLDQLTGDSSERRIIPVVGMGGIGKTTLSKHAYKHLLTVNHFDVRIWVTVSHEFTTSKILSHAISCLGESTSAMNRNDVQLGVELSKLLHGRRYLIVLDDVWSVDAWEKLMFCFPRNNNGSRIVITTRQSQVADYFGSSRLVVDFLDEKNSWELFREKIFGKQACLNELEEVGKKIVKRCKGLPLAIVLIAGLVEKSPMTQEYWEGIAKDKSLILDSGESNEPFSIFYLSYKHLPVYLRSCFLYLGLFPEDYEIDVPELIKLWAAEGLIKPNKGQGLEEVAEAYVNELIRRNLVLVSILGRDKKFRTCRVHDLVRDLCIRIAEKENFFCVKRDIDGFIFNETARFYRHASLVRPLLDEMTPLNSRLLRVHAGRSRIDGSRFPLRQRNLRFLSQHISRSTYKLPSSISLLWCLQTLILFGDSIVAPPEIWKMPRLRHIEITWRFYLPDPPSVSDVFVLQDLQKLEIATNLNFTEEVCKRIPNIKDLHIHYDEDEGSRGYNLQNLGCLNKLESLHYSCDTYNYAGNWLQHRKLPTSLKELTLNDCNFVWSDMAMISLLPHLEKLELKGDHGVGDEWNCVDEELRFSCLKHLQILCCYDLIHWTADDSNFPVLETLSLWNLSNLVEIPSGFGDIPTLELIAMGKCSESANISAAHIVEEQESLGNESLRLRHYFQQD